MREKLNCPNCGAVITSERCEYCGAIFYDFFNVGINEKSYIRLKLGDKLCICEAFLTNASLTQNYNEFPILDLSFKIVPTIDEKEYIKVFAENEM